jgi:hypothetical protein
LGIIWKELVFTQWRDFPTFVFRDSGNQETLSWQKPDTFFCCRYANLLFTLLKPSGNFTYHQL